MSVWFMEYMRRLLAGKSGISFELPLEYEKEYEKRFFKGDYYNVKNKLTEKNFEKLLRSIALDVRKAMPSETSEKVASIPLALLARDTQSAGLWQHQESSSTFIGIDYGLLRTIHAVTNIALYAIDLTSKSKPVDEAAKLLFEVFAAHHRNTMFKRSIYMELEMEDGLRFLAGYLTVMQEMFIIAHEYGHHVLGHFKPEAVVSVKMDYEDELNRCESIEAIMPSFIIANAPKQLQEVAADIFAFETMFAYNKNPTGSFAALKYEGLAPMPFLFEGLTAYEFVAYHHLANDKNAKDLFLLRQMCGTHPPANLRKDYFFKHFEGQVTKQALSFYEMYQSVLGNMVKVISAMM